MRVLSLYQPWAHFITIGAKLKETRGYDTKYRGRFLVHSSARRFTKKQMASYANDPAFEEHRKIVTPKDILKLDYGAIIGGATIIDTQTTEHAIERGLTAKEYAFGNYSPGRYAYDLAACYKIDNPVHALGALQFWSLFNDRNLKVVKADNDSPFWYMLQYYGKTITIRTQKEDAEQLRHDLLTQTFKNFYWKEILKVNEELFNV